MPDFEIERDFLSRGFKRIAGVDEAGRGALFGPVVAASVILPSEAMMGVSSQWMEEVDDSKLLTPLKREKLVRLILAESISTGIGIASNREIDENNIHQASLMAMKRAVDNMAIAPDVILVDGFRLKEISLRQKNIRQGDRKSISIAAASILAKVFRDSLMAIFDRFYKMYGIGRNKGYGTVQHYQALKKYGKTPLHRTSFNLKLSVDSSQ